ncbi:putative glycoside hydrolase family 15 protein [Amycolatopsis anabasis]|uniref:putative glycoside hydrolase family 15 protein n=1 Tax=Amycolatopsis anabasis TaxID=1840409 RepID=UPI001FECB716|nr:putative glycoside hydrolase family 15 protein [Amycolatopsis anabasis]
MVAACATPAADEDRAPPPEPAAPCAWWYGIGDSPTAAELESAARRYRVVVLNASEIAAMRRLRELNPQITVLVYKDLSSTRNYPGAVNGDVDAQWLPTGIGYYAAQREHPGWFALDVEGRRIEWRGYPRHWQMTVWDQAYQQAWAAAVTAEVVREGWDGVLADNDFNSLSHYSPAVLAGTPDAAATDRLLRDGLDAFLATAGDALAKAGKSLVPNVSETHLIPGRWTAHSRFGGAMEENFGFRDDGGSGALLTFQGNEWQELRAQATLGESWLLLVTRTPGPREDRAGYASAAILAGPRTCWTPAKAPSYSEPDWSPLQDSGLGKAVETANRLPNGVWTREFTDGWVAVNPTTTAAPVTPPAGMVTLEGTPVAQLDLPAADGVVLVRPKTPPASSPPPPPR